MIRTLIELLRTGNATQPALFPDLPAYSRGLPMLTAQQCASGNGCTACVDACPTGAIVANSPGQIALDRGLCIACGACVDICPTGTIAADRRTRVAVLKRSNLVLRNQDRSDRSENTDARQRPQAVAPDNPFRRSLHYREVSTGDAGSDLEIQATNNVIFDAGRFGLHVVASPRFADALVVTGPVPRAMREPLRRCFAAMAEPRLVIAVGASAISGGLHRGGYAEAEGVNAVLPVAAYVPGHPPHPWNILHGLFLATGRE
jgi:Ni,Fe-hydrogenase III small subunit/Pyruvate/2-oxoacid:ferredoxin oxidoreductase delta subunit